MVIGGDAAELHGSTRRTVDVDIVPETSSENLTRPATALTALGVRIRTDTDPAGLPFATSAAALGGTAVLNLVTIHGELDLTFTPFAPISPQRPPRQRELGSPSLIGNTVVIYLKHLH